MTVSLFDMTVRSYQQILGSLDSCLTRARQHFNDDTDLLNELVSAKIHEDMLPLEFQVKSIAHHSVAAIRGAQKGAFGPPPASPDADFNDLCEIIKHALAELKTVTSDDINTLEGRDVRFSLGDRGIDFVAEDFFLTFSVPNFYFHAATTYDMFKMKGVPLGKRDFLGQMRIKA